MIERGKEEKESPMDEGTLTIIYLTSLKAAYVRDVATIFRNWNTTAMGDS